MSIAILNLPVTIEIDGTEYFPLVQGGTTKRAQTGLLFTADASAQDANTVLAGPTTGSASAPSFRTLVAADIPASATHLTVGTTTVNSGTTTRVLYDNAGILGEYASVPLSVGGTNASLTASNGGIVYSDASAFAILSGTAMAGQIIRSAASSAPSWSTSTYPATSAAGTILASGSANTITATATPTLGVAGATIGTLGLAGNTSGTVTITPQAAAGTYNFNLPTGSGTSGQPLLSGGGGSTAMTFGTVGVGAGGTGLTSGTSGGIPYFSSSSTLASSAALTANAIVKGGGAGTAPLASGILIDSSNNVTAMGTLDSGAHTITSASATSLVVGANGTTNPGLTVNNSTASAATGLSITAKAATGGVQVAVTSSGSNDTLLLDAKGSGNVRFGATSTGQIEFGRNAVPTASDGAALGTTSLMWSDLMLAAGAVINFNNGDVTVTHSSGATAITGVTTVASATATPAAGSTSARLLFGTTAGFGIYYGSGAPTVSAAQGSIYLRSDGSSTSTRLYVNTNGSTTWTNVTTAA